MRYGRWTVTPRPGRLWTCVCDCGSVKEVVKYSLLTGKSTSCGCLRGEQVAGRSRTHSLSRTPEYRIYHAMKDRCYRESDPFYADYGGRGIKVSSDWLTGFEAFFRDMGPRPTARHTLERLNVNIGYSAENCTWATQLQQARNRRYNVRYTVRGVTGTARQLAEHFGVKPGVVKSRLYRGSSIESALFTPGRYANRPIKV